MINVWYFVQGWYRYLCYKYAPYLLREHIVQQFEWRLSVSSKLCLDQGECICGCRVPQLQFADKSCAIPGIESCYPKMMNRNEWKEFMESAEYRLMGRHRKISYGNL